MKYRGERRKPKRVKPTAVAPAIVAVALSAPGRAAEEKYSKAQEASLIVVGTLRPNPTFPWFDGWHLTGTIDIAEGLFSPRTARQIVYRFVCEYAACRNWPPPRFTGNLTAKAIWFLRPLDVRSWQP